MPFLPISVSTETAGGQRRASPGAQASTLGAEDGHRRGHKGQQRARKVGRSAWPRMCPLWALPGRRAAPCGTAPVGTSQQARLKPRGGGGRAEAREEPGPEPLAAWAPGTPAPPPGSRSQQLTSPRRDAGWHDTPEIRSGSDVHRSPQRLQNPRSGGSGSALRGPSELGGPPLVLRLRLHGQPSGAQPPTGAQEVAPGPSAGPETQRPEQCPVTQPPAQTCRPQASAPSPSSGARRLKVRAGRGSGVKGRGGGAGGGHSGDPGGGWQSSKHVRPPEGPASPRWSPSPRPHTAELPWPGPCAPGAAMSLGARGCHQPVLRDSGPGPIPVRAPRQAGGREEGR